MKNIAEYLFAECLHVVDINLAQTLIFHWCATTTDVCQSENIYCTSAAILAAIDKRIYYRLIASNQILWLNMWYATDPKQLLRAFTFSIYFHFFYLFLLYSHSSHSSIWLCCGYSHNFSIFCFPLFVAERAIFA